MVKPFHELFVEKLPSLVEKEISIKLQNEIEEEGQYSLILQFNDTPINPKTTISISYNSVTKDSMIMTSEKVTRYTYGESQTYYFSNLMNGLSADGDYPVEFIAEDIKLIKNLKTLIDSEVTRSIVETDYPDRKTYNKNIINEILEKMKEKEEQYTVSNPKRLLEVLLNDYQWVLKKN